MSAEQIEYYLKTLLEKHLGAHIRAPQSQEFLAQKLSAALQTNLRTQESGAPLLPDTYTLIMSPQKLAEWQKDDQAILHFKSVLLDIAQSMGRVFASPPSVSISASPAMQADEIDVIASYRMTPVGETQTVNTTEPDENQQPVNAFLILDGNKVYKLRQAVINIGRRLDNHVVINDPRVSRNHAQLRSVKGRYVLFDLNSTGGTYVNGKRISQTILYPGDTISLAGATLIYGQNNPPPSSDMLGTKPLSDTPNTTDRPTAVIDSNIRKKVQEFKDKDASS